MTVAATTKIGFGTASRRLFAVFAEGDRGDGMGRIMTRASASSRRSYTTSKSPLSTYNDSFSLAGKNKKSTSATNSSDTSDDSSNSKRTFTSLNCDTPYQLCFLRHGQSTWNRDNRFIGWTDTPLTDDGVLEARVAGQMLSRSGMRFDEVHTSLLRRCIRTTNLVLMELGQEYIPVHKHWRLNERSYGALVGKNKKDAVKKFGEQQVKIWRRSYDVPPPPMTEDHEFHPARDPRYGHVSETLKAISVYIFLKRCVISQCHHLVGLSIFQMLREIPLSESLADTVNRSSVYWDQVLAPALQQGKTLLVVGHENNLRSLLMRLEDIPAEDMIELSLPRAVPLAYRLDPNTLKPLDRPDGRKDEATGLLRGEWLGGDDAVKQILERDHKNVYDTTVKENLEVGEKRDSWNSLMSFIMGNPSSYQKAVGVDDFEAGKPVPGNNRDPLEDCRRTTKVA